MKKIIINPKHISTFLGEDYEVIGQHHNLNIYHAIQVLTNARKIHRELYGQPLDKKKESEIITNNLKSNLNYYNDLLTSRKKN